MDYNRSGVPLIEIVSEPDMRSAEEVIAYLEKLRLIIQYLGASDHMNLQPDDCLIFFPHAHPSLLCSKVYAACSSFFSAKQSPISCSPMGNPLLSVPQGDIGRRMRRDFIRCTEGAGPKASAPR